MTPKLTPKLTPLNAPLDALSDLSSLSSGSDDEDDDAEAKAEEELHAVIDTFKHQMHQIYVASQAAEQQVGRLLTRAKEEATEVAVRPLRPRAALAAWLAARGLPADPSLEECMEACLDAAEARDLDTRTLLFSKADAAVLTGGQRRVTVFDMLRLIPALFE
jgi:signal transduction histidine kinase